MTNWYCYGCGLNERPPVKVKHPDTGVVGEVLADMCTDCQKQIERERIADLEFHTQLTRN